MDSVVTSHHVRRHSGTKYSGAGSRRSSTSSSVSSASTGMSRYGGKQGAEYGGAGAYGQQGTAQLMREPYNIPGSQGSIFVSGSASSSAVSAAININTSSAPSPANVGGGAGDVFGPRSFTEGYYEADEGKAELLKAGIAYPVHSTESKGSSGPLN